MGVNLGFNKSSSHSETAVVTQYKFNNCKIYYDNLEK